MEWKLIFSKVESLEITCVDARSILYISNIRKNVRILMNHNFIFIKYFVKRDYIKDDQKLQLHI